MKIDFRTIPQTPGIYLFYNKKELLYVGKATDLRNRIRSYFRGKQADRPIEEFFSDVSNIKWLETESVIEAIILEAKYIKEFKPKHNVLGKDDKSWNYLAITKDQFPTLISIREQELQSTKPKNLAHVFGPFPGLNTKAALKILRQLFTYSTCKPSDTRACFYYQIEQCLGVCTEEISPAEYKRKAIQPLVLFLKGRKKQLLKNLNKQMKLAGQDENFEEAQRLRDQIANLQKIQDLTLLNKSFFKIENWNLKIGISKIEGYDISNLSSTGKVGSLVTFLNGQPNKSGYKRFRIKTVSGQSDVDCLAEVFERRLKHRDWPLPDLFLVDGGTPQVNKVNTILKKHKITVPLIGIAKGKSRKKNEFLAPRNKKLAEWLSQHKDILIQVRDEAHRFAISYQRTLRKLK
jgi:excinuclease ABC subunit C